jgi:hypothetical protein
MNSLITKAIVLCFSTAAVVALVITGHPWWTLWPMTSALAFSYGNDTKNFKWN